MGAGSRLQGGLGLGGDGGVEPCEGRGRQLVGMRSLNRSEPPVLLRIDKSESALPSRTRGRGARVWSVRAEQFFTDLNIMTEIFLTCDAITHTI